MLKDSYAYVVAAIQAPPSPDYVPGPEYPPSPNFIPKPVYPEFRSLKDEILPAKEQPLPAAISPTVDSPGYLRAEAPSTSHPLLLPSTYHLTPPSGTTPLLPIPLFTPLPPLLLPSIDPRADVRESSSTPTVRPAGDSRPDYGFIATLDDEIMRDPESDSERQLMASRLNLVGKDRRAHAHTTLLMKRDARMSWEAWERAMDACDFVRSENITLHTQKMAPKRTTRANPATTTNTTATTVTDAQLKVLIEQGVNVAFVARDVDRNTNGYDNHVLGIGELALLCVRMFPEEYDMIERYVGGLPDMIHRSLVALNPKPMQEVIEMATDLMDKKIRTFSKRQTETKRKLGDNQQQQQQNKRQNTEKAYTAGSSEKKPYGG
nr:hypothetical protein [Tanacetum cinerariifolium]